MTELTGLSIKKVELYCGEWTTSVYLEVLQLTLISCPIFVSWLGRDSVTHIMILPPWSSRYHAFSHHGGPYTPQTTGKNKPFFPLIDACHIFGHNKETSNPNYCCWVLVRVKSRSNGEGPYPVAMEMIVLSQIQCCGFTAKETDDLEKNEGLEEGGRVNGKHRQLHCGFTKAT